MGILGWGGRYLFYFYCHGEMEGHVFKLKLEPAGRPGYISAADLDRRWRRNWPDQPQPLVVLNACDSLALTPELIHGFLGKLRCLGASGVVGSEVKVWSQLAQPFGAQLMAHILAGWSVGEAFLSVRRDLLRRYNPLGLAYSFYAPARCTCTTRPTVPGVGPTRRRVCKEGNRWLHRKRSDRCRSLAERRACGCQPRLTT